MKIVYITTFPPRKEKHAFTGGVSSYTKNLVTNIPVHTGDTITILCNKIEGKYDQYEENGIEVIRCFDKKTRFIFQIKKEVKKLSPDIIHVQQELALFGNIVTAYLLQWLLFSLRKYQTVLTIHGVVSLQNINKEFVRENNSRVPVWLVRQVFKMIFKPLCRWAKKIIVHEQYFKQILVNEYGATPEKVHVIYHGVEDFKTIEKKEACEKLSLNSTKDIVLFLGYLTGYKGIETLIDGFALYAKQNPNAFLIIGAGYHPKLKEDKKYLFYYEQLQERAKKLIPFSQYTWAGFIPENQISLYMSAADVSVFPYTVQMSSSGPMAMTIGSQKPLLVSDVYTGTFPSEMLFARTPQALTTSLSDFFEGKVNVSDYSAQMKKERLWNVIGEQTRDLYSSDIPKTQKRVLLLGSYGQTNLGDDALLHSFLSVIKEAGVFHTIFVNTNETQFIPDSIRKEFPDIIWKETYKTSIWNWIKTLKKVDLVLFGGGTVLKELYKTTGRNKHAVTLRMLGFISIAGVFRKPCFACNIGIGMIKTPFGKWIAKKILNKLSFVTLRDKSSYDQAIMFTKNKKGNLYQSLDGALLESAFPSYNSERKETIITVGLNILHDIPDHAVLKYTETWISIINKLLEDNVRLVFLPFQTSFNIHNDLIFFQNQILPFIRNTEKVSIEKDLNISTISHKLSKIDVLIGMRFHALIYSVLSLTPFVAINYAEKCSYFLQDVNYPYSIEWKDFSPSSVLALTHQVLEKKEGISELLLEQRNILLTNGKKERELLLHKMHENV